jgi:hypothetical protein
MRESARRLRCPQFSLRTVLIFTSVFAAIGALLSIKWQHARLQRTAVESIERVGGYAEYDYNFDSDLQWQDGDLPAPMWLRCLVGDDFLANVVFVSFFKYEKTRLSDSELDCLDGLRHLRHLDLRRTQITDAGLERLSRHRELRRLEIAGTLTTDEGVGRLKQLLPRCEIYR